MHSTLFLAAITLLYLYVKFIHSKTITMPSKLSSQLTRAILFLLLSGTLILSCSDDDMDSMEEMDECQGSDPSFAGDVLPILNASCALAGCHVEGFASGDFSNHSGFSPRAANGVSRMSSGSMPPASSTGPDPSDAQIQIIRCWVEAGAKDN